MKRTKDPQQKGVHRRLALIETELRDGFNAVEAMKQGPKLDYCLLEQHEEQVSGLKSKLADALHNIATLDMDETGLADRRAEILKVFFNRNLEIQRLLQVPALVLLQQEIKIPKIDVPTFKRDIMDWRTFWEQFDDSVHSKA